MLSTEYFCVVDTPGQTRLVQPCSVRCGYSASKLICPSGVVRVLIILLRWFQFGFIFLNQISAGDVITLLQRSRLIKGLTTSFKAQLQQRTHTQHGRSVDIKDTDVIFCVNLTNVLLSLRKAAMPVNSQAVLIKLPIQEFISCCISTSNYFARSMAK